ncbi:NUDIX hydrolase [Desulfoluna limicola]|uniref:NUDIX hydrolase n=1 Tax=Desulfoluna limicola TaxID=2810562 RepID=A0ABM7PHA2_9BACT|nr:NUDIX hydrolase [Desulfoluna limicola]BCS96502.1 NUDIX hydrolase [Desulfoluna limicola]
MKEHPRNPYLTVDTLIETMGGIVLIRRKNPPHGWALPGGFVDYGESVEDAARREALEETNLSVSLVRQLHTYSDPTRDPRHHTVSVVFVATATGTPVGADDAAEAKVFPLDALPAPIVFDHGRILADYAAFKKGVSLTEIFPLKG